MQLEKRLDEMKGKTFLINTFEHTILNYKITDEEVEIETNKRKINIPIGKAEKQLTEYLPVDIPHGLPVVQNHGKNNGNGENLALYNQIKEDLPNLRKIVIGNIEKIQQDKSFIPQAQATNESINAMVNMLKLELQVMKLKNMGEK
jgi:hypothetical protein